MNCPLCDREMVDPTSDWKKDYEWGTCRRCGVALRDYEGVRTLYMRSKRLDIWIPVPAGTLAVLGELSGDRVLSILQWEERWQVA